MKKRSFVCRFVCFARLLPLISCNVGRGARPAAEPDDFDGGGIGLLADSFRDRASGAHS